MEKSLRVYKFPRKFRQYFMSGSETKMWNKYKLLKKYNFIKKSQ